MTPVQLLVDGAWVAPVLNKWHEENFRRRDDGLRLMQTLASHHFIEVVHPKHGSIYVVPSHVPMRLGGR